MQPSDVSRVAIFLFWDIRVSEGVYITGNTRVYETPLVLTAFVFSAVATPIPSQRLNCPPTLTIAQVAFRG